MTNIKVKCQDCLSNWATFLRVMDDGSIRLYCNECLRHLSLDVPLKVSAYTKEDIKTQDGNK